MVNLSYKMLENRQKMMKKIYAAACLLIIVGMGYFTYTKWNQYSYVKARIDHELVTELRETSAEAKGTYEDKKAEFDSLNKDVEDKLESIFPAHDAYTELTREIDNIERQMDSASDPFEVSNIDFQAVREEEGYFVLPLRMNVRSSRKNLLELLALIENSGSFDDENRLMSISSIRLNFEKADEDPTKAKIISFTVQIDAYFQKLE